MGKLWAGGVESVIFNYYRKINKEKFQFDFYYDADSTVEPPKDLINMGARFIKIPPYQDLFNYVRALKAHFEKNNYLIVHSNINTLGVIPLAVAKLAGVPIRIQHNHSVPGGNEVARNTLKKVLKLFSKTFSTDYFACSEKAGRWMFGDNSYNNGQVFVMTNAVDFSLYSEHNNTALKNKLNLKGKFVVGHVGRFTKAKNHYFLLKVFKHMYETNNNARLLLVGDGELKNEIKKEIMKLNLQGKVIMVGKVTNPYDYYPIMDVLLLPSIFEGLSMTTIEAQVSGKNILVSYAIPDEANISSGFHRMSMNSNEKEWAKKAYIVSANKIIFNDKADSYDINTAVERLERKYMSLLLRL